MSASNVEGDGMSVNETVEDVSDTDDEFTLDDFLAKAVNDVIEGR